MASFCDNRLFNSTSFSLIENLCFGDLLNLAINAFFICMSFVLLLWRKCTLNSNLKNIMSDFEDQPIRYKGHNLRWFLYVVLILTNFLKFSEGVWSGCFSENSFGRLHVTLTPLTALLATIIAIMFYHKLEQWHCSMFLLLFVVYWPLILATRIYQGASLLYIGLSLNDVRLLCANIDIIVYGILFLLEITLLVTEKYVSKSVKNVQEDEEELKGFQYIHDSATFLAKATFTWIIPFLKLGFQRPLELNDLGNLPSKELAEYQFKRFNRYFKQEKLKCKSEKRKLSLWRVYFKVFWKQMSLAGVFKFLADFSAFVGPLAIGVIINYVEKYSNNKSEMNYINGMYFITTKKYFENGYVMCVMVLLATFIQSSSSQTFTHLVIMEGVYLRSALKGLIYAKTLKLSSGNKSLDSGSIVNYISTDSFNMLNFFSMGHYLWAIPLKVIALLFLLYLYLGVSSLIGAATILFIAPLQYYLVKKMKVLQDESFKVGDERLRKTNELLQGIKLLKLYGWEYSFYKSVQKYRDDEIKVLTKDAVCKALNTSLTQASSILVALVTFAVFSFVEGSPLTPSGAFTGVALFNQLTVPLFIFPIVIPIALSAVISTRRLEDFLSETEVHSFESDDKEDQETVTYEPVANNIPLVELRRSKMDETILTTMEAVTEENEDDSDGVFLPNDSNTLDEPDSIMTINSSVMEKNKNMTDTLTVTKASFKWSVEDLLPVLREISFNVPKGKLTMVVGPVGSGKSSLLAALMGELQTIHGTVEWHADCEVAYAPQKPWLINASLRDNILFGKPFLKRRYDAVIKACALQPDIDLLPSGDMTEIGEKGINISGGQKQRIALARAFYTKAKTVILDDPLSALDAQIGAHVFHHGITKLLLKKRRTVLLVTHKLQFLTKATKIIVLEKGVVKRCGSYHEIEGQDSALCALWRAKIKLEEQENKGRNSSVKTTCERRSLMRMFSKQSLVKMSSSQDVRPPRMRLMSLSRQMSHDPSSPMPCQEFGEEEEQSHHLLTRLVSGKSTKMMHQRPVFTREDSTISTLSDDVWIEDDQENDETVDGQLMTQEERQRGKVSMKVYLVYMKACGYLVSLFLLLIMTATQSVKVFTDFWLSEWSSNSENISQSQNSMQNSNQSFESDANISSSLNSINSPDNVHSVEYYLTGYAILSIASLVMYFVTNLTWMYGSLRATRILHSKMLLNLVQSPMRFFDTTPIGRIINRFSSDISVIDKKLPVTLPMLVRFILLCISAIVVDSIITPFFLIIVILIVIIYYLIQKFFRSTSRELQRLDSITKSPIYSHFTETLGGLAVIRAYRDQARFFEKIMKQININNAAFILVNSANRWLAVTLDYLGGCILFIATIAAITAANLGHVSPAFVGLAMAYTLLVPIYLNWVVRNLSEVEMHMNSVERIETYSNLPEEKYHVNHEVELPGKWPEQGHIKFDNVSIRYDSTLDPVLRKISFEVHPGEKVGICGRTGSGKSSLTLGLFRMIDISEGKIYVDDIDITNIPLRTVRSQLSIIPQDVVLFSGTVRKNLDPNEEHSDEKLWEALKRSQLHQVIADLPGKLDGEVNEEGNNFSIGQRQLFCFARAILCNSKIIVMDEATASLDAKTDQQIQKVISDVFKDKTIITIAHRISTISHYDKIIVLDSGEIAEFGSPTELMEDQFSIFSSLMKADIQKP